MFDQGKRMDEYFGVGTMDQIVKDFQELELVKDGKFITKKEFKERLDIHEYGRGRGKKRIGFIGHPKEKMYAFYQGHFEMNKKEFIDMAYSWFTFTFEGDVAPLKSGYLQAGNSGIPLTYNRSIYFK